MWEIIRAGIEEKEISQLCLLYIFLVASFFLVSPSLNPLDWRGNVTIYTGSETLARVSGSSPAAARIHWGHPAGTRIGLWFVILSNRLGQDLTPVYLFMSVGQSQYSSYSNERRISEPFSGSSEDWKHGKTASRRVQTTPRVLGKPGVRKTRKTHMKNSSTADFLMQF